MANPASGDAQPARPHLKHIESVRALAALVVFVNHAFAQVWQGPGRTATAQGALGPLNYSLVAGHLAVTVFIVVSGFCLMLPVVGSADTLQGGYVAFMKRRAWRILPPYYAALVLSLLLIWTIIGERTGTLWDIPILVTRDSIISHVLLLQDFFGTGSINYVFWSIAVEWQLYFLFPLLVLSFRRAGPWVTVGAALAIGYAVRIGFDGTRITRANTHFLGMFALGMLAASIARSPSQRYERLRRSTIWGWSSAVFFGAAVALIGMGIISLRFGFIFVDFLIGLMAVSLLVHTSRGNQNIATRFLLWRPLVLIGTFSYSLYLIHAPLLQVIWQYALMPVGLGDNAIFIVLMTLGLALILGASYLFFLAFERPFMRAFSKTRRERVAEPVPVS